MTSSLRSWPKCLAVLLALALVPATASAAAKAKKKRAPTPAAEPAPAPAAAPAPAPAPAPEPDPAPAPARSSAVHSPAPRVFSNSPALGGGVGALDFAGLLALDIPTKSFLSVGPRITGEAMFNLLELAPKLRLAVGGRASFAYHSGDFDSTFWGLEFVPDAKIKFAVMDQLAIYGDLGMGLAYIHGSAGNLSDSTISFTVQFGGGVSYAITPSLNLLGEVRFDLYTSAPGGGDTSHSIAVPTVGLQFHP